MMFYPETRECARERAVKTAPGGPAGHNVRLRGLGCVPTREGGFRGGLSCPPGAVLTASLFERIPCSYSLQEEAIRR